MMVDESMATLDFVMRMPPMSHFWEGSTALHWHHHRWHWVLCMFRIEQIPWVLGHRNWTQEMIICAVDPFGLWQRRMNKWVLSMWGSLNCFSTWRIVVEKKQSKMSKMHKINILTTNPIVQLSWAQSEDVEIWGNEIKFQWMAQLGIGFFQANRQNHYYTLSIANKTIDRFELGNSQKLSCDQVCHLSQ